MFAMSHYQADGRRERERRKRQGIHDSAPPNEAQRFHAVGSALVREDMDVK